MDHALVLMTALPPTVGHAALVEFAARLPRTSVAVLINVRSFEPMAGELRVAAVSEALSHLPSVTVRASLNDEAPQNPKDHPDFWSWWAGEIHANFPEVKTWTYVVASEAYGASVAAALGAQFMPYDGKREIVQARGTEARLDPWESWDVLLPAVRRDLLMTATMFGQESVGKTTVGKLVANKLSCTYLFEYSRPYMATTDLKVTMDAMDAIYRGQFALQTAASYRASAPVVVQDTDLFSTVGYYGIMGRTAPEEVFKAAREQASSVYYLLGDDAPFTPDSQRYGGARRESSLSYWASLLDAEGVCWVAVPAGSVEAKASFIADDIVNRWRESTKALREFKRS